MSDKELVQKEKEALIASLGKDGISDLLEPLIKEIFLFDSYVAGTTYLEDKSVLEEIKEGDRLTLRREDNKFDDNAILLLTGDNKKLGYVPEADNIVFARLMDAGKQLIAKITDIEIKGTFHQIRIAIYLVDF